MSATDQRVRIGIVGLRFGRHIVEQLVSGTGRPWFELAAVCDMDADRAKAVGDEFGVERIYTDLEDLLNDDSIPVIGLFTGPSGRAELIERIISRGKDVITTKPFELDCAAALRVLRRARDLGRTVHINSPSPLLPEDLAIVKRWQQEFDLGQPVGCQMSVWVRYNEKADGNWYDNPVLCPVAPVFRLGIYLINDIVRFLGEAEQVTVLSSRMFTGRPTADNGTLAIRFKGGALCTIFASFCVEDGDIYQNSMTFNFERGTVYRNTGPYRKSGNREVKELAVVTGTGASGRKIAAEAQAAEGSGAYQWKAFYDAVNGKAMSDVTTPEQVVAALRVIEAMGEADRGNGTAAVRPVE